MITIQNYLLEEEISDASMDDIALEQAIAEFEVATALLECQLKCQMIMENTTTSLDDFDVFMENGFTDAVKGGGKAIGNFFKGVGKSFGDAGKGVGQAVGSGAKGAAQDVASGAKNVAGAVVDGGKSIGNAGANLGKDIADNAKTGANWFKTTWNTIITAIGNFFTNLFKVDFEKLIKKVEEDFDDDHKFELHFKHTCFVTWINKMDKLTADLLSFRQNDPYDKSKLRTLVDELNKFTEERKTRDKTIVEKDINNGVMSKSEFITFIKGLNEKAKRSYKSYGQLKKALDLKNLDKDVDKDLVKMYKDLARAITKNWSMAAKDAKKVINTAMGNATKKESSDDDEGFTGTITGESATISMQESTDFDDIDAMTFQESEGPIQESSVVDNMDDEEFDPVFEAQFDEVLDYIFQESAESRYNKHVNKNVIKGYKQLTKLAKKAIKEAKKYDSAHKPIPEEIREEISDMTGFIDEILEGSKSAPSTSQRTELIKFRDYVQNCDPKNFTDYTKIQHTALKLTTKYLKSISKYIDMTNSADIPGSFMGDFEF